MQVQEETGVPPAPDWVDIIHSLDITLDEHQTDKLCMLLKCHTEMLERQAMCSKMLAKLGKLLDPVMFCLILQTVIWPLHQINLPDLYLLVLKQQPKKKAMREMNIICCITPNPNLMKEWANESATLYLTATIYYWLENTIAVADPGFPIGGCGPHRGHGLPRQLRFIKCICQNERIGSLRGGACWVCPP